MSSETPSTSLEQVSVSCETAAVSHETVTVSHESNVVSYAFVSGPDDTCVNSLDQGVKPRKDPAAISTNHRHFMEDCQGSARLNNLSRWGLIKDMAKTQKELAFLRDLYIQDEWTQRFTDLVDKHMDLSDSENMLYLNAGTGGHALAIHERFGEKTAIFASCEDEDMLTIARDKAAAVSSDVDFSMIRFENDAFDAVLADASFVPPPELGTFIDNTVRVARTGGDIAIFMPSVGSFGEVFSLMWEAFFTEELMEHAAGVEKLVAELPTSWHLEKLAADAGMVNINTQTALEVFDFEDGAAFIASPLVADFLMPVWLATMDEDEKERVNDKLAQLVDDEGDSLSFRFTVKATLVTGEKE